MRLAKPTRERATAGPQPTRAFCPDGLRGALDVGTPGAPRRIREGFRAQGELTPLSLRTLPTVELLRSDPGKGAASRPGLSPLARPDRSDRARTRMPGRDSPN